MLQTSKLSVINVSPSMRCILLFAVEFSPRNSFNSLPEYSRFAVASRGTSFVKVLFQGFAFQGSNIILHPIFFFLLLCRKSGVFSALAWPLHYSFSLASTCMMRIRGDGDQNDLPGATSECRERKRDKNKGLTPAA